MLSFHQHREQYVINVIVIRNGIVIRTVIRNGRSFPFLMTEEIYYCASLTISNHLYSNRLFKVWSMLHHKSVGWVQNKGCSFIFKYAFFFVFLFLFFIMKFVFLSFPFLFLIKYQNFAAEYKPIRNWNWW